MDPTTTQGAVLLKTPAVKAKLGSISTTTLWRLRQDPTFPRPVSLRGLPAWVSSELDAWIESQPRLDRTTTGARA
jgi:predicted DNA-binding transcriptional regulator AlpA